MYVALSHRRSVDFIHTPNREMKKSLTLEARAVADDRVARLTTYPRFVSFFVGVRARGTHHFPAIIILFYFIFGANGKFWKFRCAILYFALRPPVGFLVSGFELSLFLSVTRQIRQLSVKMNHITIDLPPPPRRKHNAQAPTSSRIMANTYPGD